MATGKTAPPIPNRLELPLGEGRLLRVDFDRAHDRWSHRVLLVLPAASGIVSPVLLFDTVEGNSAEDWPASPPLQFVSVEERPKKPPVALLMGMAGGSHWSASIEQLPDAQALRFDIACRTKSRPENLGSRYRVGNRVEVQPANTESALILFTAGGVSFELAGEAGKDSPAPLLHLKHQELQIHLGEPASDAPRTYRWLYRIVAKT